MLLAKHTVVKYLYLIMDRQNLQVVFFSFICGIQCDSDYAIRVVARGVLEPSFLKVNESYYLVTVNHNLVQIRSSRNLVSWEFEKSIPDEDICEWMQEPSRLHIQQARLPAHNYNFCMTHFLCNPIFTRVKKI